MYCSVVRLGPVVLSVGFLLFSPWPYFLLRLLVTKAQIGFLFALIDGMLAVQ